MGAELVYIIVVIMPRLCKLLVGLHVAITDDDNILLINEYLEVPMAAVLTALLCKCPRDTNPYP